MAESSSEVPFDLEKFKELVSLMEQHGLSEIDLKTGPQRWRIRRGPPEGQAYAMPMPMGYATPAPLAPAPAEGAAAAPEPGTVIRSPTVGTFYSAASPGEEPYVTAGSKVSRETVVCIIEAMKVMNHITADLEGTILEVLVRNGDAVEFNQPLFRVKLG